MRASTPPLAPLCSTSMRQMPSHPSWFCITMGRQSLMSWTARPLHCLCWETMWAWGKMHCEKYIEQLSPATFRCIACRLGPCPCWAAMPVFWLTTSWTCCMHARSPVASKIEKPMGPGRKMLANRGLTSNCTMSQYAWGRTIHFRALHPKARPPSPMLETW